MSAKRLLLQRPDLLRENEFSTLVRDVARLAGWRGYHTYDSRRSNHGFPDWVFVRNGRIVFAELKAENGRVSDAQREWLDELEKAEGMTDPHGYRGGVEVHLWRPSDWDAIVETLTGRRPVQTGKDNA